MSSVEEKRRDRGEREKEVMGRGDEKETRELCFKTSQCLDHLGAHATTNQERETTAEVIRGEGCPIEHY